MISTKKYKTYKKKSLNITKRLIKLNKARLKSNHLLIKTRATSLNKSMMNQKNQSINYKTKFPKLNHLNDS